MPRRRIAASLGQKNYKTHNCVNQHVKPPEHASAQQNGSNDDDVHYSSENDEQRKILSSKSQSFVDSLGDRKQVSAAEAVRMKRQQEMLWIHTPKFQSTVGFVIFLNAVSMGAETDFGEEYRQVFYVLEHVFTVAFTLELIIRWRAQGVKSYFQESGNLLDFCLVMMSIVDVWILGPLLQGSSSNLRALSLLRLIRLIRLARLLRLFRVFKELTVIVAGMTASGRTLFWSGIFLMIIVYIFAIFATQRFGQACEDEFSDAGKCNSVYEFHYSVGTQYSLFGTMDRTMLTLYICVTEGCGFEVIHPMILTTPWAVVFWYVFMFSTCYGIMNVIIGVFCENVIQSAASSEKELQGQMEAARQQRLHKLFTIFNDMDMDGSETISREEFIRAITTNDEVIECMEALGLQEETDLFDILDIERDGELDLQSFFEGMILLAKGDQPAKVKDMVSTYLTCQAGHNATIRTMDSVTRIMDELCPANPLNPQERESELDKVNSRLCDLENNVSSLHTKVDGIVEELRASRREFQASQTEIVQSVVAALQNRNISSKLTM